MSTLSTMSVSKPTFKRISFRELEDSIKIAREQHLEDSLLSGQPGTRYTIPLTKPSSSLPWKNELYIYNEVAALPQNVPLVQITFSAEPIERWLFEVVEIVLASAGRDNFVNKEVHQAYPEDYLDLTISSMVESSAKNSKNVTPRSLELLRSIPMTLANFIGQVQTAEHIRASS